MTHEEKAVQAFRSGANCAQSVVVAFHEELDMDEATALRLASSFGGGIGRLREVCGAVSGMLMVYGMLCGYDDISDQEAKKAHYTHVQALVNRFREIHGTFICRELLELQKGENSDPTPTERNAQFFHARPCADYVATAAKLLDEALKQESI